MKMTMTNHYGSGESVEFRKSIHLVLVIGEVAQ